MSSTAAPRSIAPACSASSSRCGARCRAPFAVPARAALLAPVRKETLIRTSRGARPGRLPRERRRAHRARSAAALRARGAPRHWPLPPPRRHRHQPGARHRRRRRRSGARRAGAAAARARAVRARRRCPFVPHKRGKGLIKDACGPSWSVDRALVSCVLYRVRIRHWETSLERPKETSPNVELKESCKGPQYHSIEYSFKI